MATKKTKDIEPISEEIIEEEIVEPATLEDAFEVEDETKTFTEAMDAFMQSRYGVAPLDEDAGSDEMASLAEALEPSPGIMEAANMLSTMALDEKSGHVSYTPTDWVNAEDGGTALLNAENLNHIEQGIADCAAAVNENTDFRDSISYKYGVGRVAFFQTNNRPAIAFYDSAGAFMFQMFGSQDGSGDVKWSK